MVYRFFFLFILISQSILGQLLAAKYSIKNISINTRHSDYGAAYFGPNKLVFASSAIDAQSLRSKFRKKRDENDNPSYDLFAGFINNKGEVNYVKRIMNNFNTKYNESNVSFTPDLKHVYFTQNNISEGHRIGDNDNWINLKIFRAKVDANGEWTNVISLPFNDDSYSCAHPSVSEDGKMLFFTSDMPGSLGQSDIFWVTILEDGNYGEPQNIGAHVNSTAKENFPYVDKNLLYFSSNREGSKGGLDIYMVPIDDPNAVPVNLGSPVNSAYDDFCFVIDRQNKKGYFSSNRPNGKGNDDIYFFQQETEIKQCKQVISGVIRNKETSLPIEGAYVTMFSHDDIMLGTHPVGDDGYYRFELACRDNYTIEARKDNYSTQSKSIGFSKGVYEQNVDLFIQEIKKERPVVVKPKEEKEVVDEVKVEEIVVEEKIVQEEPKEEPYIIYKNGHELLNLPPIYFDLDQYYLTKEAIHILGKAIDILHAHPNIYIEFAAHTDCRASDSYNLHLSNLRAKEVVNYLRNANISRERIKGRGYGESRIINGCVDGVKCTEKQHLQNRRTEFIIIKR